MEPTSDDAVSVDAGRFGEWLTATRAMLRGEQSADVPCGGCVGCCVSSYPIPLRPTDRVALEKVPPQHLHLPADPSHGLARMGFREDGACPLLCGRACSIYNDRPQTCRDYDCRIYAAAGLLPDGDRPVIRERVLAWRFEQSSQEDRVAADAVLRAAQFIHSHASMFPPAMRTGSAAAVAVLAVKVSGLFRNLADLPGVNELSLQAVQRVIDAACEFDAS